MRKVLQFALTIVAAGAVLAATVIVVVPALGTVATAGQGQHDALDLSKINDYAVRSDVYASDGSLLATLHGVENRQPVSLDQIPAAVKDSVIAYEDSEFYKHPGVNVRAMGRALIENVQAGGIAQGGSTITQQLVKNVFLTSKQDLNRKTKEVVLALRLEHQLTKDQILEAYLNTVYFGSGAYGVEAAAETYWGVHASQLGWAEGAMLAAIIRNPVAYDPTLHPQAAKEQRKLVLDRLLSLGYITQKEHDSDVDWLLPTQRCTGPVGTRPGYCGDVRQPTADNYFSDQVLTELLDTSHHEFDKALGTTKQERYNAVFGGGLKIYTTLDPYAQMAAQWAHDHTFPDSVAKQAADKGITTALVSIDPATGAVRALIGGPGFDQAHQYDVATQEPGRQTGSSFKAFVLLTALQQGNIPTDFVGGTNCWPNPTGTPNPYCISGPSGTLTSVTQASSNGAFVRLGQTIGLQNVADMAHSLGVTTKLDPSALSMPLGVFDVTPLEMASAYSAIPNGGVREPEYFIDHIDDRNGNTIYSHTPDPSRAFSETTACYATQILKANVQAGTATNAQLNGYDAAGKTGTTDKSTDTWFVGFTEQLTTAVWMGIPSSGTASMGYLGGQEQFGGLWPAKIWQNFNQRYLDFLKVQPVPFPTCPDPGRAGQPAHGAADPYGTLNGGVDPTKVPPTTAPVAGSTATTAPTTTGSAPPPTTAPPTTAAPSPSPSPSPKGNK